jgi:hypothetical protein
LIKIANEYADAYDDACIGDENKEEVAKDPPKKNNKRKNPEDKPNSEMADATFGSGGRGGQGSGKRGRGGGRGPRCGESTSKGLTNKEFRDMPCMYHSQNSETSTHSNHIYRWVNKFKNDPEAGYKSKGKGKAKSKPEKDYMEATDSDEGEPAPKAQGKKLYPIRKESFHTFLGTESMKARKAALHELNATVPSVPQYLDWSQTAITWDRSDHPGVFQPPHQRQGIVITSVGDPNLCKDVLSILKIILQKPANILDLADVRLSARAVAKTCGGGNSRIRRVTKSTVLLTKLKAAKLPSNSVLRVSCSSSRLSNSPRRA